MADYFNEGYQAAQRGDSFSIGCPYTFQRSGLTHTAIDQRTFEIEWRPKMDMWFKGWKQYLDENGLGFNFQPKRNKKDKKP